MVGSLAHLEQIPIVTVTFVQATIVLAAIVHIRNISAVADAMEALDNDGLTCNGD